MVWRAVRWVGGIDEKNGEVSGISGVNEEWVKFMDV